MNKVRFFLLALIASITFSCSNKKAEDVKPLDVEAVLVNKVWKFTDIRGKVNNGTIKDEVTIFKDGKNQYYFYTDLSYETYQFDADGKAWINSDAFEWALSSDKKTILIGEKGKEKTLRMDIISFTETDLKLFQKGWTELVGDNTLTNKLFVDMDVTISMSSQPVDPFLASAKSKLIGKTWKIKSITGKVINGKSSEEVTIFKDGKSQYGFEQDLSKTKYVFKENDMVDVTTVSSVYHSEQTSFMKWLITGDNGRIRILSNDRSLIVAEWLISNVADKEIKVFERSLDLRVTDNKLVNTGSVSLDAELTLYAE